MDDIETIIGNVEAKEVSTEKSRETDAQSASNSYESPVAEEHRKRTLVIPGDELGAGRSGHGTYEDNGKVYAKVVGLHDQKDDLHFVIPLQGIYDPKREDGVIGRVIEIIATRWILDINAPYEATMAVSDAVEEFVDLTKTDLTRYFTFGDLIFTEIYNVTRSKAVQVSMKNRKCRKLRGGRIIRVTPAKVPRIIGRAGSMVEMIKNKTGAQIVVGQNGIVWVKGGKQELAAEAVLEIEEKAQMDGLTDAIGKMLDKRLAEEGGAWNKTTPTEENENKTEMN
ncbi:MAG: exosome complex RNA-binding protein Rrp4 [Candidatus Aenigmatarchaeota archaeon]